MTKLLLTIAILATGLSARAQQDSLTIAGVLKGLGNAKVRIMYTNNDTASPESYAVNATNDTFSLKVPRRNTPTAARFNADINRMLSKTLNGKTIGTPSPMLDVIVYQSNLIIKGTVDNLHRASVKGDAENTAYTKYRSGIPNDWALQKQRFSLDNEKDSIRCKQLDQQSLDNFRITVKKRKAFITKHPHLFTSVVFLDNLHNYYTAADYETAYNNLGDTYKSTKIANQITQRIAYLQPVATGKPAINFVRKDKDGKEVNLANYKGKLVLLDFWGSWSISSRGSNPLLKDLYAKYKDKGFEVIGIADENAPTLEQSRKNWVNAIEKDSLGWVHVLNQEGIEQQNIVKDYRVTIFPTKVLLDKEGKMILRITASVMNDLDKLLEKLL